MTGFRPSFRPLLVDDRIQLGEHLFVSFQRTLLVPDDGRTYPLPPGLGRFPIHRAADHADRVPIAWKDDFLIPMYRREALWIAFEGESWTPQAVRIGVGGVDAISGEPWTDGLDDAPQNYVVAPDQPWLDGINTGAGTVRQFVAMPLGEGYGVEAQVTGRETTGGIQVAAYAARPGRFPDKPPARAAFTLDASPEMGIAVGGALTQKIYPDAYGLGTWDPDRRSAVFVRLLDVVAFEAITGSPPPPTPVDAAAYTQAGLPWFTLYDHDEADLDASATLAALRAIREIDGREREAGIEPVTLTIPARPR